MKRAPSVGLRLLIPILIGLYLTVTVGGCASLNEAREYVSDNYVFKVNGVPVSQLVPRSQTALHLSENGSEEEDPSWWKEHWPWVVGGVVVVGGLIGGLCAADVICGNGDSGSSSSGSTTDTSSDNGTSSENGTNGGGTNGGPISEGGTSF